MQRISKKQSTLETSVFGIEFVVIKQGVDVLRDLRFKLRMMNFPILGPLYIYGDNMSVMLNRYKSQYSKRKLSLLSCSM